MKEIKIIIGKIKEEIKEQENNFKKENDTIQKGVLDAYCVFFC